MELKHQIDISMRDFILFGKFDYIKLGKSKNWILNHFPKPDDWTADFSLEKAPFWRYGTIEFHFTDDNLSMIFTDNITTLNGGEKLSLDLWVLENGHQPTLAEVINELNNSKINYTVNNQIPFAKDKIWEGRSKIIVNESGVELIFDSPEEYINPGIPTDNSHEFTLTAIDLVNKKYHSL